MPARNDMGRDSVAGLLANLYYEPDFPDYRADRLILSVEQIQEAYEEALRYGLMEPALAYLSEINRASHDGPLEACPSVLRANARGISQVH